MGFNAICAVSRLAIECDEPVRAFVLAKGPQGLRNYHWPGRHYFPITPSLKAQYDFGGGVHKYRPSEAFKITLRNVLNDYRPPDVILGEIMEGDYLFSADKERDKPRPLALAMVHEEIYQGLIDLEQNYDTGDLGWEPFEARREEAVKTLQGIREIGKRLLNAGKHASLIGLSYNSETDIKDAANKLHECFSTEVRIDLFRTFRPFYRAFAERLVLQGAITDDDVQIYENLRRDGRFHDLLTGLGVEWLPVSGMPGQCTPDELHMIFTGAVQKLCTRRLGKRHARKRQFEKGQPSREP